MNSRHAERLLRQIPEVGLELGPRLLVGLGDVDENGPAELLRGTS